MPLVITLIGALIGNILGYTVFKNFCAGMYYGSYSLPTYRYALECGSILGTTLVPLAPDGGGKCGNPFIKNFPCLRYVP